MESLSVRRLDSERVARGLYQCNDVEATEHYTRAAVCATPCPEDGVVFDPELDGRQYLALTVGGETPALIALRLPY